MLEKVKLLLETNTNRESFFAVVGLHFPPTSDAYRLIQKAYDASKDAFHGKFRDGGEIRYFEHLRSVALIVMVYLRVRDPHKIIAALLHDIIEDVPEWTYEKLVIEFGTNVAEMVWYVTKPDISEFKGDKEERNRAYHATLSRASRDALIIKLADRLHNMLTLWSTSKAKQVRKIRETQDFYLPLAEKEILLIHELEAAVAEMMQTHKAT